MIRALTETGCKSPTTKFFDPPAIHPRNSYMLTGLDASIQTDGLAPVRPARSGLNKENRATKRQVSNKDGTARLLWVGHMTRIRDHQDKKAFAELFEHFAPRVKGFLMKSGADATLAEECTQDVMATLWHKSHQFGNQAISRRPTANLFTCKGGHLLLAVNNEKQFQSLLAAIGLQALADDPRFADWPLRVANETDLRAAIEGALAAEDAKTWEELESTFAGANIDENWHALFRTIELFRRLAVEVGDSLSYNYPYDLDQRITDYLLKIKNLPRNASG